MARFEVLLLLLLFAMATHSSATWCVCRDLNDSSLQKTIDYACGAGADCNPIHSSGPCYNPNTVRAHCSYAANSYFQKQRQQATACDFAGTATVVTSDPSSNGCSYPASATSTTPTSGTPGSSTTVPGSGSGNNPLVTSPSGVLGGANNGLGPSGMNDDSNASAHLPSRLLSSFVVLAVSVLAFWWS